ncbi:MAG: hypothetical protein HGA19_16495 [Oscillochloris sp.]|nr:hypothetical protein [Oscillochloris sp.]
MGELLGALGLAWPRLLLYPGGLGAFGLAWLLARWMALVGTSATHGASSYTTKDAEATVHVIMPLVALALLPLPPARSFPYGMDLVVALALLGWPRLYALAVGGGLTGVGLSRALRGYSLLVLGATLLGASTGSMELSRLLEPPHTVLGWGLLLVGTSLWFAGQAQLYVQHCGWAGRLGELGHLWVGALPMLVALNVVASDLLPPGWSGWVLPPLALSLGGLVLGAIYRWGVRTW